ncbi:MAG TPA: DNA repair protein Rad50, partial [Myxococcaceae bacterium]|nr:DNA repair protein Rad50 [Myxococcaceae bacterium]
SRERLGLEEKRAALEAQGTRAAVALEEDLEAARRLLGQAGCEDGEALARREAEAARFAELSQRGRELRLKVETAAMLGVADARARLLEAGGAEALAARRAQLEAEVQRLSAERQEQAEARGGIRARLDELERDLSVAGYRAAEERLVAQAGELAHRYAVDRLALSLLQYAKQLHEQQHQPRLVQLASRAFEALTAGRYTRVLAQVGEERALRVRDADGTEWSPEQLSRGTREQLYLAFRLAVIQDFGEVRAPLPVIVDDILVNFDPERTRNTVKALAQLARSHQVLAFTCHPYLAAMFEEEGARLTELPVSPRARARAKTA